MTELYLKILAAVAPAIILAIILIRKDRKAEPTGWLITATILGVLVAPAVLILGHFLLPDISGDTFIGAFLTSFIDAAIPEEGLKFVALFILASRCRHFDEAFDGVVYAVCIGMGFAGIENILYLFGADDGWILVGISRALLSIPAHYFFAVIMGSFFSLGWFDRRNRKVYFAAALVLPIIVHGLYDTLCFSMTIDESLSGLILIAFIIGFRSIRKYVKTLTDTMKQIDAYKTREADDAQ